MGIGHLTGEWWRHAAIYQIYPRSFADGNGDGEGDIAGMRSHLDYLRDLGIDAVWISPWYVSPLADGGYDVADYRDIDPRFGTLDDARAFIDEAHQRGIRVIVDIVPNHCSDQHRWFREALAAGPGSAERERFWFRPGRGEQGELPPNDWESMFGGPAWSRVTDSEGGPGEWYLHMFAPEQPDWNWDHPDVRAEFETTLRFWLQLGVDGFRIDVADMLVKDPALPDLGGRLDPAIFPYRDQEGVHEIYRLWRRVADEFEHQPAFVAEAWLEHRDRYMNYLRPDELHTAFNFPFLQCAWQAEDFRAVIHETLDSHATVEAAATWVLSNHDVTRHVSRYGRADSRFSFDTRMGGGPPDLALGTQRARAAALLTLALPGSAYIYQGEELGLPEVEDIAEDRLQDPIWLRSGHTNRGRDGCRVPLPWLKNTPSYGFSPADAAGEPWLPQPEYWGTYSVQAQADDPQSMLALYRRALQLRRTVAAFTQPGLTWLPAPDDVLAFARGGELACLVNLSTASVPLPEHTELLLASSPLRDGELPPDTAVWLRIEPAAG